MDTIRGVVQSVFDNKVINLKVNHFLTFAEKPYQNFEKIKIKNLYSLVICGPGEKIEKDILETILKDREVRCYARSIDESGRIEADVVVL